jgi:hypothetical protein
MASIFNEFVQNFIDFHVRRHGAVARNCCSMEKNAQETDDIATHVCTSKIIGYNTNIHLCQHICSY